MLTELWRHEGECVFCGTAWPSILGDVVHEAGCVLPERSDAIARHIAEREAVVREQAAQYVANIRDEHWTLSGIAMGIRYLSPNHSAVLARIKAQGAQQLLGLAEDPAQGVTAVTRTELRRLVAALQKAAGGGM